MTPSVPQRYSIQHHSRFEYEVPKQSSVTLARLHPRNDRKQHVRSFLIESEPAAVPVACSDSFGNKSHILCIFKSTKTMHLRSSALVETAAGPDLDRLSGTVSWEEQRRHSLQVRLWHYLAPSRFVRPGEALDSFSRKHGLRPGPDPLTTLTEICGTLHSRLEYVPGSTTVDSTLDCILKDGRGVCQDFTHVMLALGRGMGIPSRYVSGYIFLEGSGGSRSREVASHAWAEFWLPQIGWIGFDPTNNTAVDSRFVRVAQGRDYADAAPNRGIVFGGGVGRVDVNVVMEAATDEGAPDSGSTDESGQVHIKGVPWRQHSAQAQYGPWTDQ